MDYLIAFLLVFGAAFAFIGSLGLVKLPDFYMRLHGPTKATTLGIGSILGGSILYMVFHADSFAFHEFLVTLFLFITAPVSAHLMSKAALHRRVFDSTGEAPANTALARAADGATETEPGAVADEDDDDDREEVDPLEENLDGMMT